MLNATCVGDNNEMLSDSFDVGEYSRLELLLCGVLTTGMTRHLCRKYTGCLEMLGLKGI